MKLLLGTLILGVAASVFGQEASTATAPTRVAVQPAMATDIIIAGVMKQNPFTGDEIGETVKIMPDGNRIVQSWTGKIARNSQGRIRREITSGQAGDGRPVIFGGGIAPPAVVALGAGEGKKHVVMARIDAEAAASRTAGQPDGAGISVVTTTGTSEEGKAVFLSKIEAVAAADGVRLGNDAEVIRVTVPKRAEEGKYQTRKESLGTRDFGGVQADGVRVITTFLPGAVGNEREFEVTSERWFSKDLGVLVYSKQIDPRVGETTYQLTNINRSEPDSSLFPGVK